MGMKETIGKAIVVAFEQLGGDPASAVEESKRYPSVDVWVRVNQAKTGVGGAVALGTPGAHLALMTADVLYLLRTMARVSWGIGALKNKVVHGDHDLEYILGLWTGAATEQEIEAGVRGFAPVKQELRDVGIHYIDEGIAHTISRVINLQETGTPLEYIMKEVEDLVPGNLSIKFGGKKAAVKVISKACGKLASKGAAKLGLKLFSKTAGKVGSKFSAKLVNKLVAKMTPKLLAKFGAGFAIGIGAVVGGGINVWFTRQIADAAMRYYDIEGRYY